MIFLKTLMQEISGRMPLVQAVQEAGRSLVRISSILALLQLECLRNDLGTLCVLDPLRLGVDTLHLTISGSVWRT